ncbi:MAG: hypothetical protein ACYTGH_21690 [Planctomycetota bacterium]|jgi:hypothetical protein
MTEYLQALHLHSFTRLEALLLVSAIFLPGVLFGAAIVLFFKRNNKQLREAIAHYRMLDRQKEMAANPALRHLVEDPMVLKSIPMRRVDPRSMVLKSTPMRRMDPRSGRGYPGNLSPRR